MAYTEPVDRALAELVTPAIWNAEVAANFRAMPPHLHHLVASDQAVSTTMTAVTGFTVPVTGTETWWLWASMVVACPSGNWNVRWTFPSGGTLGPNIAAFAGGSTYGNGGSLASTSPTSSFTILGNVPGSVATMFVTYKNGGTGGNVVFEAAGTGTTVTIKAGHSHLWVAKLA